jgi:hypothetical protein
MFFPERHRPSFTPIQNLVVCLTEKDMHRPLLLSGDAMWKLL